MRKIWILAGALGFVVSGCEDGPGQIYEPSPENAKWNDGENGGAADNAKNGFGDDFNATSKQELCSAPQKQKAWAEMVKQPLVPPRMLGGLDVAGGDLWPGLNFEDAEKKLCQSDALGTDGQGSVYASWGDAGELQVGYSLVNHKINFVQINQGYRGPKGDGYSIEFKSRPTGKWPNHTYKMGVGKPIQRDDKNFELLWEDGAKLDQQGTELFDAMMYTFAPDLPSDDVNCRASGACRLLPDGVGGGGFGARNIGFYIHVPSISKPQPIPSTPDYFYLFPVKVLPFSNATMFLKMDAEGPIATAKDLGDRTPKATCNMKLGIKYNDFLTNCVTVLTDASQNQSAKNKLLGNLTHTHENFIFDVVGVNLDFNSEAIGTSDVIHDDWVPQANDEATEYLVDIRANGKMLNEYSPDGKTFTFGGTAAIYREYARLVQEELHKRMDPALPRHPLGDPACFLPENSTGVDLTKWRPAAGCTGMEQFVTPAKPDTGNPGIDRLSVGPAKAQSLRFTTVMKPGDPIAVFCADPWPGQYTRCGGATDQVGFKSSVWDGTYKRVLDYLGNGNVFSLPSEARDRKFYFKVWAHAYVHYLKAAALYPTDLSKPEFVQYKPEPDHLLFDDLGSENEKFEYIDRRFVSADREPLKFEYEALITSGNQRDSKFHRRFTRDERTLYMVMEEDKTSPPGDKGDNVRLTNLIGSTVLYNNWYDVSDEKTAYYCATKEDDECKAGGGKYNSPPKKNGAIMLDDYGQPILTNYKGAFTSTVFTLGSNHIKMVQPLPLIQSAKVAVPNYPDPYAPFTGQGVAAPPMIETLGDWRPKAPNNGFRVVVNGQRDKFYPAESIDFTGSSLSLLLDVERQKDNTLKILAVQSNDYMGDVFLCRDPATGDLLRVEQYESMAEVIDWIHGHPGSYDACGFIIRYSPFNNYPHLLAATKAGIVLTVNQGSGFGRISTVEVYDTNL
jgi:hypothetical protein